MEHVQVEKNVIQPNLLLKQLNKYYYNALPNWLSTWY